MDPHHVAHAPISAVSAGFSHSAAVTAGGALYTWGESEAHWVSGALGLSLSSWKRRVY